MPRPFTNFTFALNGGAIVNKRLSPFRDGPTVREMLPFQHCKPDRESQRDGAEPGPGLWGMLPVHAVSFVDNKRVYSLTA